MPNPDYRPRRKRKKSWMVRLLLWSAVMVVVLVVGLVIATPWLVRTVVPEAFARFGLEASASGGRFNPLSAEITVEGFALGAPGAPAISLDELGIGVGLRALAAGRVELKHLRVKGVDANTDRLMSLWKRIGDDASPGSGGLPIALDDVELTDIRLTSVGERIGHDVRIAHLGMTDPVALASKGKSRVDLQGTVGAGRVDLKLDLSFDGDTLDGVGTFRLDAVPLRGWAELGGAGEDPLTAGTVSGRGDVHVRFESTDDALGLILDGPLRVDGLALAVAPIDAERGDASWKGRLALHWKPAMSSPNVRGDGSLEVEALQIVEESSARNPIRADLTDVSWHGEFDWKGGLAMQAGILGTRLDVRDVSSAQPLWQGRADDFSMRMRAEPRDDAGALGFSVEDFDLSRLNARVGDAKAPMEVTLVKLAVGALHTTRTGRLALDVAGADSVVLTAPGVAGGGDSRKLEAHGLTARGMTGDTEGAFRAASVKVESAKYSDDRAKRTIRIEGIGLTGVGLAATGSMGTDRVQVASARVREPSVDVWISDVDAARLHGDGSGHFGAGRVAVARMFQSPTDGISWQASGLVVDGIDGGVNASTGIAKIELPALSVGIGDASWDATGLHAAGLAVTRSGDLDAARLGFESLEHRQTGSGELRVATLEGNALRVEDMRAVLDKVTSAAIEYRSPNGLHIAAEDVASHGISGDQSSGVAIERLTLARGTGQTVDGTRLAGSALASRGIALGVDGAITIDTAELTKLSGALPDAASIDVEGAKVVSLKRVATGALSAHQAAIGDVRLARDDGSTWMLARLAASGLAWQSESGIGVDEATLESVGELRGEVRQLLGKKLLIKGLEVRSPSDIAVSSLTAGSFEGDSGTAAWKVEAIEAEGFERRAGAGERLKRLGAAKIEVSDSHNGARLSLENARARMFRFSETEEVAASSLRIHGVRIASENPDLPSRVTLAGLQIEDASLRPGVAIDAHEVIARNPYIIVARTSDKRWLWPPLPGGGGDKKSRSGGGFDVHVTRFSSRGPGRFVFIDRGTEPAFQLALDPLVVALENLDTRLAGSKAHFRARGIGDRFADIRVSGELTRRVETFDLHLEVDGTGLYLPHFNPYVERREPVDVSAGWSDVKGTIDVVNHRLGGDVKVLLSGLEIKIKDHVPVLARLDPEDFPLRTALALLKDAQGNIHIDVPLQAQTTHENFDFIDTFQAAFGHTVIAAGDVARSLPDKTVDSALRVIEDTISLLPGTDAESYSPIEFVPGSDAISASSLVFLGQLAERMQVHPALEIALCGRAVPGDSEALHTDDKAASIDALYDEAGEGVYHVYDAGHEGLLELARARAGSVRRRLRDLHGVANRRLAACKAEVETSSGERPRVDVHVKTPASEGGLLDFL